MPSDRTVSNPASRGGRNVRCARRMARLQLPDAWGNCLRQPPLALTLIVRLLTANTGTPRDAGYSSSSEKASGVLRIIDYNCLCSWIWALLSGRPFTELLFKQVYFSLNCSLTRKQLNSASSREKDYLISPPCPWLADTIRCLTLTLTLSVLSHHGHTANLLHHHLERISCSLQNTM